jgi:hypothetical protein
MSDTITHSPPVRTNAPLQFWIVSILSLIWNGFLAFDYVAAQTRNIAYLRAVTQEVNASLAWANSSPSWAIAAWAISVWGSLAGSLLLLLRSRHAVAVFIVALASAAVNSANQYATVPAALDTPGMMVLLWAILLIASFFWWYARRAKLRGVLG